MSDDLVSLGVDVGTTTTQVVVSELRVTSPANGGKLEIAERTVRHRGEIRETPLSDPETVDIDAVAGIVEDELGAAGIDPIGIDTGAVIVTGETARKGNAEALVHRVASEGGEFVAAAAGPELEAILAGRGSGATTRARDRGEVVANADVGGGTTNVAVFDADGVRDTRCLDVGGRLVRFDERGAIASVSPPARELADDLGIDLEVGREPSKGALERLADAMADCVIDAITGPPFSERTRALAIGELPTEPVAVEGIAFTGGVGRLVNAVSETDPFEYGDLGPTLAAAIGRRVGGLPVVELGEDIRATVVGVGTRTTELSGRTIGVEESLLPLRDLPVAGVGDLSSVDGTGLEPRLRATIREATSRHGPVPFVLAIEDVGVLSYDRLTEMAGAIAGAWSAEVGAGTGRPVVVLVEQDCAKALGQALGRRLDDPVAVIDEVRAAEGEYLDVGRPLGGDTVPVVVKTLAF
ncbi:ethanolamine ammonia-lyase reactivating factor EutA [Halalkalicoccus tibetensis]|uniref:Ethanolamine ammonia-lyase reactivating factor EutA n=1 Tax=Halalkalicoccus tibetensis TaxID=175632 RepID=A0ABD5V3E1_9EURY